MLPQRGMIQHLRARNNRGSAFVAQSPIFRRGGSGRSGEHRDALLGESVRKVTTATSTAL
jgi:hypothetical protein